MVVYHGTKNSFNIFSRGDIGFHFGNKTTARTRVGRSKDVNLLPVYLSIKNPLYIDNDYGDWSADISLLEKLLEDKIFSKEEFEQLSKKFIGDNYKGIYSKDRNTLISFLNNKGYDGIIYKNFYEANGSKSYIAFNPNQIKSINNRGTFDSGNNTLNKFKIGDNSYIVRFTIAERKVGKNKKKGTTGERYLHSTCISNIEIQKEKDENVINTSNTLGRTSSSDNILAEYIKIVNKINKIKNNDNGKNLQTDYVRQYPVDKTIVASNTTPIESDCLTTVGAMKADGNYKEAKAGDEL